MSAESDELVLYLENEEPLYRQMMGIFRALAKKKDRGIYDPAKAPKAFVALLAQAAQSYVKEFGTRGDRWNLLFSPIARREAAQDLTNNFESWYAVDYQAERPDMTRRRPKR